MALMALGALLDSYLDQTESLLNDSRSNWESSPSPSSSRSPSPQNQQRPERRLNKTQMIEEIDDSLDILGYLLELTGLAKAKHDELSRHLAEISLILCNTSRDYLDISKHSP